MRSRDIQFHHNTSNLSTSKTTQIQKNPRKPIRTFVVVMLIIMGVTFALISGSSSVYLVLYMVLGFIFYPSWKIRRGLQELNGRIETGNRIMFQGESLTLTWILEATQGPLPPMVHILLSGSAGLSLENQVQSLVPEPGLQKGTLVIRGVEIGMYRLDTLRIVAHDPLGLLTLEKSFVADQVIRVYPPIRSSRVPALLSRNNEHSIQGFSFTKTIQGESLGLRSWRPGDGIKSIHWKQSLHHDNLLVQETGSVGMSELVLILNCFRGDYQSAYCSKKQLIDWVKTKSFSLIYQALEVGIPITLVSQETKLGARAENYQDASVLLDEILIQPGASELPFSHLLGSLTKVQNNSQIHQHNDLPRDQAAYFLVTPRIHKDMEEQLWFIAQENPQTVVVVPDIPQEEPTRISQLLETLEAKVQREPLDSNPLRQSPPDSKSNSFTIGMNQEDSS